MTQAGLEKPCRTSAARRRVAHDALGTILGLANNGFVTFPVAPFVPERRKIGKGRCRLEKTNPNIISKKNDGMTRHSVTVQQMKNQRQAMIRSAIYSALRNQDLRHVPSNERHLGASGIRRENVDCCVSVSRSIQFRLLRFGRGVVPGPSSRWAPSLAM